MIDWAVIASSAVKEWFTGREIRRRLTACEDQRAEQQIEIAELKSDIQTYRELALIGTVTVDPTTRIVDASAEMETITGYDRAELLAMRLNDLLPYRDRPRHQQMVKELFEGKRALRVTLIEAEIRCKQGNDVGVLVKLAHVHSGSGANVRADIKRR